LNGYVEVIRLDKTAYFDNAATTFPKPEPVYKFMDAFYRAYGVNVGRGQHKPAAKAAEMVTETRNLLLELNHCPAKKTVFTHTATEALNIIMAGLGLCDGFNVFVSPFEHNAVTRVLHHLRAVYKLNVMTLAVEKNSLVYDLERIKYQFVDKPPHLVVISHASNVCGVVAPITEICRLAKQKQALTVIDMAQTMGLVDTDLSTEDIDYAVFAGHKTLYAPLGIAGFICAADAGIKPLLFGGTGVDSANPSLPETIPERFEVGSPNVMAIAGLNAALKWASQIGIGNIHATEQTNRRRLIELLAAYDIVRMIVPEQTAEAIGVVSCLFDGYGSDSIGQILSEKNVAVRTGLHCAPDAHRFLGTFPAGTVRFSVSYFNTGVDYDMLAEALDYICDNS
jgi:cysteine desulfurase family protein